MRMSGLIVAAALLTATGCMGTSAAGPTGPTGSSGPPGPVATQVLPVPALRICVKLTLVASMCPTRVPKGRYLAAHRPPGLRGSYADGAWGGCISDTGPVGAGAHACPVQAFYLEAGSPAGIPLDAPAGIPGRRLPPGRRTRPPIYVHLILYASRGSLTSVLPFAWPGVPTRLRNGLERHSLSRKRALDFGQVRWAGHRGRLVLAPPLLNGGELGDHLIYRWRSNGVDHLFSMHSWEPLLQAVATLRLIVSTAYTVQRT